ncbi:MAG: D-glycero-beta-D-manno-heptose 1-phosphate adenylyltransferase, partial [Bacteroidales bacterium]|nr:D-glycero-beta-D-manno-heptose 1-phosphate adenylyltransferase [Bacteroidales bacterium]
ASLEAVDYVVVFEEDTPFELIKAIMPDVLVKGGDYTIDKIVGADVVTEKGGTVLTIPFVEGYSSTKIISKFCSQSDK